ncbi:MAG: beta-propeller fold lactonase family protein, partial [Cytophagales bacterium]
MKKLLFALLYLLLFCSCQQKSENSKIWKLAVGTYTDTLSKGIYILEIDSENLNVEIKDVIETPSPSFLAFDSNNKNLFAVNELENDATISRIILENNKWQIKSQTFTLGAHPCHVSVDKFGKNVFVANYNGSNFVQFFYDDSLSLNLNLKSTLSGPNQNRQEKSHIHMVYLDENRQRLYVTDLGGDVTLVYPYLYDTRKKIVLDTTNKMMLSAEIGGGPRHLASTK